MNELLLEQSLSATYVKKPTPDIIHFLGQTAWGCNGLQYYVKNYEEAFERLPEPHFYVISESGRIEGTVMFFFKAVNIGSRQIQCVYLTQLAVHPDSRGRGLAGQLVSAVVRHAQSTYAGNKPVLVTAYIEDANSPSLAVFKKQGFFEIGQFHGTVINRLHPKRCLDSTPLQPADLEPLKELLTDYYAGHALADFEWSLKPDDYRVILNECGQIMAGLQGHIEEWSVTQMEGKRGWFVVNVLGKHRWVQEHLFNPAGSRFVHIGNLFARRGHEKLLYRLIEDVLARERVPFATGYFDKKSPAYQRFASSGSFGLLNAAMETPVRVMGWTRGLTKSEIDALQRQPLVISPLDIS